MKKIIKRLACITAALALCFGVSSCQKRTELTDDLKAEIETAYLAHLNEKEEVYDRVEILAYVGEYSGQTVAIARRNSTIVDWPTDIVEYTVDGVTLAELNRNDVFIAYNKETYVVKNLRKAYEDGDISKSDLWLIKFALN